MLEAQATLDKAHAGDIHLTMKGWYDLTLFVTGDKQQAEDAAYQYVVRCYEAEEKPQ